MAKLDYESGWEGISEGLELEDIANIHEVALEELQQELEIGIEVEYEHTTDEEVAKRIAMDHLVEYPYYYTRLLSSEEEHDAAKPVEEAAEDTVYKVELPIMDHGFESDQDFVTYLVEDYSIFGVATDKEENGRQVWSFVSEYKDSLEDYIRLDYYGNDDSLQEEINNAINSIQLVDEFGDNIEEANDSDYIRIDLLDEVIKEVDDTGYVNVTHNVISKIKNMIADKISDRRGEWALDPIFSKGVMWFDVPKDRVNELRDEIFVTAKELLDSMNMNKTTPNKFAKRKSKIGTAPVKTS